MKYGLLISLWTIAFMQLSFAKRTEDNLTLKLANERFKQVKSVDYELEFVVTQELEKYQGSVLLKLELNSLHKPLQIDSFKHLIKNVIVNEVEIKDFTHTTSSLDIPAKYLKNKTVVKINFEAEFSKTSGGFKRSVDPEDKSVYMYTDFEPYYAHHLFPCFDQPNLKATFTVKAKGPSDWLYIGNELVDSEKNHDGLKEVLFKKTPPISTYLFFFGAGPFYEWKDQFENIPLRLYARKSLKKYVDAKNIFETTKKGLGFFQKYFDYPYPFSKFGQIFVPEFSWGGMENPGAITLNERNIFRGAVSSSRLEDRESLIFHEMAHMWFGDLVTMDWWNDLWLNESFATYLATLAQNAVSPSTGIWPDFFSTKTWGYWQDQLITTHPIETPVPDVRTAKANFDGITYAKGASSLKQLHFYVGDDGFKKGIQDYFKKFAFKNATRQDFIQSIETSSKIKLSAWTKKWLQTKGLNKVKVSFSCKEDKVSELKILQQKSQAGTFNPHRTKLAFFKYAGGKFTKYHVEDVSFESQSTKIKESQKIECPDFIFPNWEDHDYALYSFDSVSLNKAAVAMTFLDSPLARYMIWSNLSQMVRDQELHPMAFFEFAKAGLGIEQDDLILGLLLSRYSFIRNNFFMYLNADQRKLLAPELENILLKRLGESIRGSSNALSFFDFYVSMVTTKEGQTRLAEMLDGKSIPAGIKIDQDRRWAILNKLSSLGATGSLEKISLEEKTDPTKVGEERAYQSKVSIPELENKKRYWDQFLNNKELNFSLLEAGASSFHSPLYPELSLPFINDYFKKISAMNWNENDSYVEIYFDGLFPRSLCSRDLLKESQRKFKLAKNLTSISKRSWLEANDELGRCVKVREMSK